MSVFGGRRSQVLGVLVPVVAALVLLAGCGGSSKKSSSSTSSSSSSSAAPATSSSASSSSTSTGTATSTGTTTSPSSGSTTTSPVAAAWTQYNGNLAGTRDVKSSINSSNASKLGIAWTVPITGKSGTFGNFSSTPVIVGGVAYFQDMNSGVWAIKMSNGKLLWHTKYNSVNTGPDGVNVVDGKVYGATATKAFALSAATGEQLWSKNLLRNKSEGIDMAPAVNNGIVYVSTVPGNAKGFYDGNGVAVLWAMNAKTGKTLWKWNEVPYSLWGHKDINSGGGQWQPPTFDAQGHLFLNVANPAPFVGDKSYAGKKVWANGSSYKSKALYTDTVDELDPKTGKLIWHYQVVPHDIHDWDMNNQALISTVKGKEAIISAGKGGIAVANDAKTGKLLWRVPVGQHNGHDNDGINSLQGKKIKDPPYVTLPGELGGVETPYASDGTTTYFPVNNTPVKSISQAANATTDYTGGTGVMVAIDQNTGKIKWQHKFTSPPYGAATVSNDLVWTTTFNGMLWALNKSTGAVVWHKKLPAGTNAPLAIDGDSIVLGAGFPEGAGQKAVFVRYQLGATGSTQGSTSSQTKSSSSKGGGASSSSSVSLKAGESVFKSSCASCHTLAAAGSTGTVGPNLDQLKPSEAVVAKQVTNGGGGMPAFGSQLSKGQITSVAQYVSKVAGTKKSKSGGGGGGAP
jgi:outer membrane protein assembly factor BamB